MSFTLTSLWGKERVVYVYICLQSGIEWKDLERKMELSAHIRRTEREEDFGTVMTGLYITVKHHRECP